MRPDLSGQVALVTGGTRGVGLAVGQALAHRGAHVWLTHRWGSADEAEVVESFGPDAPRPHVVEADVGNAEDTRRLMSKIARTEFTRGLDIFVSNVAVVGQGDGLDKLSRRDFRRGLDYSAWPMALYLETMEDELDRVPHTIVAMSSDGVENAYRGYDYVALSKSALEAMVASLARQLSHRGIRVFALRTRQIATAGFEEIFPAASRALLDRFEDFSLQPEDAGEAVLAMASGLLNGLSGQVLVLDRGSAFMDNLMTVGPVLAEAAE